LLFLGDCEALDKVNLEKNREGVGGVTGVGNPEG